MLAMKRYRGMTSIICQPVMEEETEPSISFQFPSPPSDVPLGPGREVHVTTTVQKISHYVDSDHSSQICFRCGQTGHVRFQCLSYKVRLCWHYQQGMCHDRKCSFAHGPEELRQPWKARCVRVIKHGGRLICIGCNSTEHTFRKCPHNQNIVLL